MRGRESERYAIAARLLGVSLAEVTDMIRHTPPVGPPKRDYLRSLVDWVEDYERHDQRSSD